MAITPQSNPEQFSNYTNSASTGSAWQQTAPVSSGGFERNPADEADRMRRNSLGMTIEQARSQADQAFSGIVAPMTLEDIRAREMAAKESVAQSAESVYNPQISREKQLGGNMVSTAEGVVGQRQGFNISTAELAFVGDVQTKVQDRIKSVEDAKSSYITSGNLSAADRADQQLEKLNEWNTNLTIAKANYALQLMSGSREEAQLELSRMKTESDIKMAEDNLSLNIANLTGEYNGSPTFAATQSKIQNALAEAGITGFYNGTKTLESVTSDAQLALQRQGLELDKLKLQETIRNNRATEARLGSGGTKVVKTPTDVANETIGRLVDLRNTGKLNDANYAAEVRTLASALGYDADSIGSLESIVNNAMAGDQSSKQYILNQANQSAGSDFMISSPEVFEANQSTVNAVANVIKDINNKKYSQSKGQQIINDLTVNMTAEQKNKILTAAQNIK